MSNYDYDGVNMLMKAVADQAITDCEKAIKAKNKGKEYVLLNGQSVKVNTVINECMKYFEEPQFKKYYGGYEPEDIYKGIERLIDIKEELKEINGKEKKAERIKQIIEAIKAKRA